VYYGKTVRRINIKFYFTVRDPYNRTDLTLLRHVDSVSRNGGLKFYVIWNVEI